MSSITLTLLTSLVPYSNIVWSTIVAIVRWLSGAAVLLILSASIAQAQTPRVVYDFTSTATLTLAIVQSWTPVFYVNGQRMPQTAHTCTQPAPATITCSFPLPDISGALTGSGPQTFEVSAADLVLGEGPRSAPLARLRPAAPGQNRFELP